MYNYLNNICEEIYTLYSVLLLHGPLDEVLPLVAPNPIIAKMRRNNMCREIVQMDEKLSWKLCEVRVLPLPLMVLRQCHRSTVSHYLL